MTAAQLPKFTAEQAIAELKKVEKGIRIEIASEARGKVGGYIYTLSIPYPHANLHDVVGRAEADQKIIAAVNVLKGDAAEKLALLYNDHENRMRFSIDGDGWVPAGAKGKPSKEQQDNIICKLGRTMADAGINFPGSEAFKSPQKS